MSVGDDWAMAARDGVSVGHHYYPNVMLRDFIPELRKALTEKPVEDVYSDLYQQAFSNQALAALVPTNPHPVFYASKAEFFQQAAPPESQTLTYDNLFVAINHYLQEEERYNTHFVVSDAGFSLLGAQTLQLKRPSTFYSQASWLSIGYSLGAVVGLQTARASDEQSLVFVGDGSFQETSQAISDLTRTKTRNIVFVLNNENFYGIEQMLVDPCFYRNEGEADVYNFLHPWNYEKLADVFHHEETPCHGAIASTLEELSKLLDKRNNPNSGIYNGTLLVRVMLDRGAYPKAIQYKVDEKAGTCKP